MADSIEEFLDGILSRLGSGPILSEEELLKSIENMDRKLKDAEHKMRSNEEELKVSFDELQATSHQYHCQSDSGALNCFLNNVLQAVQHNTGLEDHLLNDLLKFCHRNYIVLPPHTVNADINVTQSHSSLNVCIDEDEEKTLLIWNKIKSKLKNGIVNIIKNMPLSDVNCSRQNSVTLSSIKFRQQRRLYLFKLLSCIYDYSEVVETYCQLCERELESKIPILKSPSFVDDVDVKMKTLEILDGVIKTAILMLNDDLELFQCFDEDDKFLPFEKLLDIYSSGISTHLYKFIECFAPPKEFSLRETQEYTAKFSAKDLRNFAKVFYILDNWSTAVEKVLQILSIGKANVKDSDSNARSSKIRMSSLIHDQNSQTSLKSFWNWKEEFKFMSATLKKAVPSYIQCVFSVVVNPDSSKIVDNSSISTATVAVSDMLLTYNSTYPLQVSHDVGIFISLISEVILFAKYDEPAILNEIREETIVSLIDALHSCTTYFCKLLLDFKTNPSCIDSIYQTCCNICLIQNQLECWGIITGGHTRRTEFATTGKSLDNLKNDYVDYIIKYHLDVIKSSIVYDAHSNNWQDDKALFEGERCSFPIQMWNLYIRGVIHDVHTQLPTKTAKHIIKEICTEMLTFFVFRYVYVKASYRHLKQLRADILVLLYCFKWVLLYLADNATEYMDLDNTSFKFWHTLCTTLLETLVITTAPISLISSYFDHEESANNDLSRIIWYNDMYVCSHRTDKRVISYELLVKQPVVDWNLLVLVLISNHAELPILMIKNHSALKEPVCAENEIANEQLNEMFQYPQKVTMKPLDLIKFHETIYFVLLQTSSTAFVHYMASIIENDNSKSFKVSVTEQLPIWLQLIAKDLNPFFRRIFSPAIDLLFYDEKCNTAPSFAFTKLEKLPCDCPAISENDENRFSTNSQLLHKCLMETLDMLIDKITVIPEVIWDTLAYVKDQERFTASWIQQRYLGTKILASLLYHWLLNDENVKQLKYGKQVSEATFENVKSLAELIWHVVFHLTHDVTENPKISMHMFNDLRKTAQEVNKKLSELDQYCNRDEYSESNETSESNKFENENTPLILNDMENGIESMRYISSILKINQAYLRELLLNDEQTVINEKSKEYPQTDISPSIIFDPVVEFEMVGNIKLNHANLLEMELDWPRLISLISNDKWKTLLINRFEFDSSNESFLTDNEKEAVTKIKAALQL